jgi:hypothetical protein
MGSKEGSGMITLWRGYNSKFEIRKKKNALLSNLEFGFLWQSHTHQLLTGGRGATGPFMPGPTLGPPSGTGAGAEDGDVSPQPIKHVA